MVLPCWFCKNFPTSGFLQAQQMVIVPALFTGTAFIGTLVPPSTAFSIPNGGDEERRSAMVCTSEGLAGPSLDDGFGACDGVGDIGGDRVYMSLGFGLATSSFLDLLASSCRALSSSSFCLSFCLFSWSSSITWCFFLILSLHMLARGDEVNRYIFELLVEHGASLKIKNKRGETPLDVAVKFHHEQYALAMSDAKGTVQRC